MKRTIATLLTATAWTGVYGVGSAHAEPVSLFISGIIAGASGATVAAGSLAIGGALGAGTAVGTFLAANVGTLLLAGASLLYQALQNRQMESSQVNFRQPNSVRRHAAGIEEVGGSIVFASYASDGAFWYVVAHCDSELMETIAIKLDDIVITKDGSNKVTTGEFVAEQTGGFFGLFGSTKPYFTHWLCTFGPLVPVPDLPPEFKSTFPDWTTDHKLAGVTCSVIKIDPIKDDKDLGGVYRWRGAIGLGEPSVSVIGVWGRIPDPRAPGFDPENASTWGASKNPALIAAWHRKRRQGFNMAGADINWDLVADNADKSDVAIIDRDGDSAPLYSNAGGVWLEDRENKDVEMDILAACDGMSMFDSDGRWYPKVGFWEEPTLTLNRDRDIFAMQDSEATDGESETDGVIVEYKEPSLGYVMQPCAPWKNPNFYVEGREPKYLTIKVPTCKNHRQAVTIAKAVGLRSQPTSKIAPQTGLRGRRAKRERIIAIDYDETINGTWQVVTPVELDAEGATASLGLVPVDANNWVLLPGEEGAKPVGDTVTAPVLENLRDVLVTAVPVAGTSDGSIQLKATFDAPVGIASIVEIDYSADGGTSWLPFSVTLSDLSALSPVLQTAGTYLVRFRTGSAGGQYTGYSDPPLTVAPAAPGPVTSVSVTAGIGKATFGWIGPGSTNYAAARIYVGAINDFASATLIRTEPGTPSAADSYLRTGMSAGTYYAWIEAINGYGIPAPGAVATGSFIVT